MTEKKIRLEDLELPADLKKLTVKQCVSLCREIRKLLVRTVSENGGHLSSNLGTVELTVSLHRVFDSPKDKIVWDVGHQAYTHKILTGRLDRFGTIRREGGISGFARPSESVHDAFISGHSSTSISAACGIAQAMKMNGDNEHHVIAVIGDGAFTGGEAYEGMNNAGKICDNLIVILNNNGMSISRNVGAFAKYLASIRSREKYVDTKHIAEDILDKTPVIGKPVKKMIKQSKSTLKWLIYRSTMFEDMGFVYLGPVDGHNISELDDVLRAARKIHKPVLINVKTVKGKGFRPAEKNPGAFHGVSAYELKYGNPEVISDDCFSAVFGRELSDIAESDERICAVTAAMKYGTGLHYFAQEHPERFFDVGIAEQHAVTFCCGLAAMGKIPVFSVYSSFLQRAFDQILHDAAIPGLHIVLCVDRAGIVGEDGETHQGLFDVSMISAVPGTVIYSPSDYSELRACLRKALYEDTGIAVVRYPRGKGENGDDKADCRDHVLKKRGGRTCAVSYGRISAELEKAGVSGNIDTMKLLKIHPVPADAAEALMEYDNIVFFEEACRSGGIGSQLEEILCGKGFGGRITIHAIDGFVSQASSESALSHLGFDSENMLRIIRSTENKVLREDNNYASGCLPDRKRSRKKPRKGKGTYPERGSSA